MPQCGGGLDFGYLPLPPHLSTQSEMAQSQDRLGRFPGFDLDMNGHVLTNSRNRFRAAIEH
jgi:hypothetical protein